MGQNAQIIMGQIVYHYSLTTGGPGPGQGFQNLGVERNRKDWQ